MGTRLQLSAPWASIWDAAASHEKVYIGPLVRYLDARGVIPAAVAQRHFEAYRARLVPPQSIGHLNTVIAKYNSLAARVDPTLPYVEKIPNRHDRRAAENAALPQGLRDEIERYRVTLDKQVVAGTVDGKTRDAIIRRLLGVARREKELRSFVELAEPRRLGDFVLSYEKDPDALQLTPIVSRTRALQDVVKLLVACDHEPAAEVIAKELATHPKHSLAPAQTTLNALMVSDDLALDAARRAMIVDTIVRFVRKQHL